MKNSSSRHKSVLFCLTLIFSLFIPPVSKAKGLPFNLWMGSMNIENQSFNRETLDQLFRPFLSKYLKGKKRALKKEESVWAYARLLPDIIVLACQECKPNKKLQFPGDILERKDFLGKQFVKIESNTTIGMTKIKDGFSTIHITLLVKKT